MDENIETTGSESEAQKQQHEKSPGRTRKILLILILLIGLAVTGWYFFSGSSEKTPDAGLEKFIQADFIDLSKIYSISKFRSGAGHDFSQRGESCRSMKHYFAPQWSPDGEKLRETNGGMPPRPDGSENDIAIYSPVDGEITGIQKEKSPIGEQIYIKPNSSPSSVVRLFHVYLDDGYAKGKKVKAGEKIGDIGQYSTTDIAVKTANGFVSYFDVMPDDLFAKYLERGVTNREELIFSKDYRDANPLECNGENFAVNYDSDPNSGNYVYLSGFIDNFGTPATTGTPSSAESSSSNNSSSTESSSSNTNSSTQQGSGGGSGTGGGNGDGQR